MRLKFRKKYLIPFVTLTSLSLLPTFLSTPWGNLFLSKTLSEILDMPLKFKGEFFYFKPCKIRTLTVKHPKATLEAEQISGNYLLSMLLLNKIGTLDIGRFTLTWSDNLTQKVLAASLNPFLLSKFLPIQIDCRFKEGTIIQGYTQEGIYELEGRFFYQSGNPLEVDIKGRCGSQGTLTLQGHLDPNSNQNQFNLNIQGCSKYALPASQLATLLGDKFDLELFFTGGKEKGETGYLLNSEALKANGSFRHSGTQIRFDTINTLEIDTKQNLSLGRFSLLGLKGELELKEGELNLNHLEDTKNLQIALKSSFNQLIYDQKPLGSFSLEASGFQKGLSPLQLSLSVFQEGKQKLSASGVIPFDSETKATLDFTLNTLPLIGFAPIGNQLNLQGHLTFENHTASGELIGSSPMCPTFKTEFLIDAEHIHLKQVNLTYLSPSEKLNLSIPHLKAPLNALAKVQAELKAELTEATQIDSSFLPLKAEVLIDSLSLLNVKLASPAMNVSGLASYNPKDNIFYFKNNWDGLLNLPAGFRGIHYSKTPVLGTFHIASGSSNTNLKGNWTLQPFELNAPGTLMADGLSGKFNFFPYDKEMNFSVNGAFKHEKSAISTFQGQAYLKDNKIQKGTLTLKNLPLESLACFHEEAKKLALFLGKNLNCDLEVTPKNKQLISSVKIESDNLHLKGSFIFGKELMITEPLICRLNLFDLNLPFMTRSFPFTLKKPCELELLLNSLRIPSLSTAFEKLDIEGSLICTNVVLSKRQEQIHLDAFKGELKKAIHENSLTYQLDGDVYSNSGKTLTSGSLHSKGRCENIQGPLSKLDFSKAKLNLLVQGDHFPTLFLDFFQNNLKSPYSTSFGEALNIKFDLSHDESSGAINTSIQGKETLMKLSAKKIGSVYTLSDDLIIQTPVSPELSTLLFSAKPMGIEKFASGYPVSFKVKKEGSTFSLFPFSANHLNISDALLEMGQLNLECNTLLPQALSLLKASSNGKNIPLWLQPIHASIKQGMITFPRFDFLVSNRFQMALWGSIDLVQDQVGMILGLTASCLQKAFGITELPSNYVLQVPISGKLENVKIDSKKGASKIGKILALRQGGALVEKFGGKGGAAIGGLLKELSKIPDGDKQAPEPITPFPWDQKTEKTSTTEAPKKAIRSSDSPVKQLLKMFF